MRLPADILKSLRRKLVRAAGWHDRDRVRAWLDDGGWASLDWAYHAGVSVPRSFRSYRRNDPFLHESLSGSRSYWAPPTVEAVTMREPTEEEKRQRILPGLVVHVRFP